MATILRAINDEGVKYDLDLMEDVPFRLDISAIESGDIGKVFGISSQQLTLPPTKTNNDFFGNLYDVGASPASSFIKTLPCQVLEDGIEIFTGKIYLDSVVTDNRGNDLYNVVVVNETVDFNFLIKDTTFGDLDFSSLNHTYSYGNITGSWDKTLLGGAVYYPLVNYGFDEENPLDTQIKGGGQNRTFSNYNSPIRVDDFKPAIRVRKALDAIFDKVNYTYTSSFFTSGHYTDDIYMLSTKDAKKGISDINPVSQSFQAYEFLNQDFPAPSVAEQVVFTDELFDNAGQYDTATSTFTAGENGIYQFELNLVYQIIGYSSVTDSRFVDIRVYKNGSPIDLYNFDLTGVVQGQLNVVTQYYNLSATDDIDIRVSFTKSGVGAETFRVVGSTNTRFKLIQGPTSILGGTVDMSSVFSNISVPEFLQGLIEKFNLVIEPVKNERNVLRIEPFNNWVDQGNIVDWSDKVDYSQKWKISHPLQGQPKNIKFTDVEDNIAITQYHKRTTGKVYGVYDYISESDLASGEKTIGRLFAPTPMKGIDGAPMTVLPALAEKDDSSQPLQRTSFAPRLLFHNGRQDALGIVAKNASGALVQNQYFFADENGTVHTETDYGLASHLQALPAVFGQTIDLHFGNNWSPGHYNYHQPQFNGVTKNTAFYQYWSFYINELYDIDSRKVVCNVFLEPTEIPQIQLNDKIFIDGHYYRINKINGADISKEDSVEVELIKTLPRKLRFPRRRVDILGDTPVDITVDDAGFEEDGFVVYEDFESGAIYTGSAIQAAAERDGFQVYGDKVVWNTQKPVQLKFTNQTNVGLNRIDESAEIIDARGDNNVVANNVQISRVEGSNNEIKSYSQFVNVRGEDHVIGQNVSNVTVTGQNHIIGDNVSFANIFGGTNAIIDDGIIGSGSFNAIINTDEGNILGGRYNTLLGGFGGRIESSSFSTMIGENHYISSSKSTILIDNVSQGAQRYFTNMTESVIVQVGKDMDGSDYPTEKLYVGDTYFTEEIAEDFFIYTGSVGTLDLDSDTYSGIYSFILTPSGTGELEVILPPCGNITDRGYRRKLKFTTQNRSGATFKFSTTGADTFYVEGSPSSYDFNFLGASITLVAAKIGPANVWVIEEQTRGSKQNEGAYGSFYSTSSQAIAVTNTPQLVTMGNTFTSKFTSLSGSGTIEMDYAGAYGFTYTAKVQNAANAIHYADFWIKYNGTDYPNSTVRVTIPARKSVSEPFTSPVTVSLLDVAVNNGDKIELYWRGDSTDLSLEYETFGGTIPNQPSVRAVIQEV